MHTVGSRRITRSAVAIRAGFGAVLLLRPRAVVVALGEEPDRPSLIVCRVLGLRHLVEAGALGAFRNRIAVAVGVTVDAIHCLTALVVAETDTGRRRLALINAGSSALFVAAGGLRLGRRGHAPR